MVEGLFTTLHNVLNAVNQKSVEVTGFATVEQGLGVKVFTYNAFD